MSQNQFDTLADRLRHAIVTDRDPREGQARGDHEHDLCRVERPSHGLRQGSCGKEVQRDGVKHQVCHLVRRELQGQSKTDSPQVPSICVPSCRTSGTQSREGQDQVGSSEQSHAQDSSCATGQRDLSCPRSNCGVERVRELRGGSLGSSAGGQQSGITPDAGSPSADGECHGSGTDSPEQIRDPGSQFVNLSASDDSHLLPVDEEHQTSIHNAWEEFMFSKMEKPNSVTDPDVGENIFQCHSHNWVAQEMWTYMKTKGVGEDSKKGRNIRSLLLEVYCSSDSQLVGQANKQGFVADRHGLKQGDLRDHMSRIRLYDRLLTLLPRHVWVSPRCKAWCKWNIFNMSKNPLTAQKVIEAREEDRIHLLLCDALFQFQTWRNSECHFHLEQPQGSHMIAQEELASIVDQLKCARCDMCVAGQLKHPETGDFLKKGTQVWTTSQLMCEVLDRLKCPRNHHHTPIEGSIRLPQQRVNLSQFTELYTRTFALRIIRCMTCSEVIREPSCAKSVEYPVLTTDNPEPLIKRRRHEDKQSPPEGYLDTPPKPTVTLETVAKMALEDAPKVGTRWFTEGKLFNSLQEIFPDYCIQSFELCKGADRFRRSKDLAMKQNAPWRLSFGIHRQTGEVFREPHWENWSLLSCRQQTRKCTPSRLLITVFASQVKKDSDKIVEDRNPESNKRQSDAALEDLMTKRHKGETNSDSKPLGDSVDSEDRMPQTPQSHGPKFQSLTSDQKQQLIRMRNNLGHPDSTLLGSVLRDQGWPSEAIEGIKDLHCPACFENQRPKIARPSHLSKAREFNELVLIDGVEWTAASGNQFYFYHILDSGTNFHIAFRSTSRDTQTLIDLLGKHWVSWAGPPQQIMTDSAGEFRSEEFCKHLQSQDIKLHVIPGEAHWQMGKCERHGAFLQTMLNKYQSEHPIDSAEEFDKALIQLVNAKNSLSRHRGYSPEILVLGKSRHLPVSNSADDLGSSDWFDSSPDHISGFPDDSETRVFQQNLAKRECARRAFISADVDQKIRRSYLQRSRPMRERHSVGSWVMYWRNGKGNVPGQWLGPARVVLQDAQDTIWLSHSSRLFRCAPEHVRSLSQRESDTVSKMDNPFQEWPKQLGTGVFQYHDLTNMSNPTEGPTDMSPQPDNPPGDTTHPVNHPVDTNPGNLEETQPDSEPDGNSSIANNEPPDGYQVPIPQDSFSDDGSLLMACNEPFDHWIIHQDQAIRIHSEPRMKMFCPTNVVDCPIPVENLEKTRETCIFPRGQESFRITDQWYDNVQAHRNLPFSWTGMSRFKIRTGVPQTALITETNEKAKGCEFILNLEAWEIDKCVRQTPEQQVAFLASAAKRQKVEVREKDLSEDEKKLFISAKHKEVASWLSTETVRKITRSQIPESQILRSRWVLTWKPLDSEQVSQDPEGRTHKPKARLVILGFEDPHLETLARDSPTMGKDSRMLLLQFAASQKLPLRSFDIQTAFLRGSRQDGRILGMEPPEEMRVQMKLKPWEFCELLKSAYGLVNAPLLLKNSKQPFFPETSSCHPWTQEFSYYPNNKVLVSMAYLAYMSMMAFMPAMIPLIRLFRAFRKNIHLVVNMKRIFVSLVSRCNNIPTETLN